jgi:hypothetical protein
VWKEIRNFGGVLLAGAIAYAISGPIAAALAGFVGVVFLVVGGLQERRDAPAERFAPTLTEVRDARAAQARMEREELERDTARIRHQQTSAEWAQMQRSQKVDEYYRALKEWMDRKQAALGSHARLIPIEPVAAEGEDPQLVKEAWLKYKSEQQKQFQPKPPAYPPYWR